MRLLRTYKKSVSMEAATTILLLFSIILALAIYNSKYQGLYNYILDEINIINNLSVHMFINDFLMAIFFLVAGLEIKKEILHGNLSSVKKASFPLIASLGGVIIPIMIYVLFTLGTPYLKGLFIPMSTDIAFSVGVFLIFSKKFSPSLKIFLLSLAVIDDLLSIVAIGFITSTSRNFTYLFIAFVIFITLIIANRIYKIKQPYYYLIAGFCLWYFIYLGNVHPTISGVLLAFTIPCDLSNDSVLDKLQKLLVPFNSLIIIPLFAFANTGITLVANLTSLNVTPLVYGIVFGLCIGKPLGIMLFSILGCSLGICEKPRDVSFGGIFLVSLLCSIGFTMSIFICELTFIDNTFLIGAGKMSILIASFIGVTFSICCIATVNLFYRFKIRNSNHIVKKHYIS